MGASFGKRVVHTRVGVTVYRERRRCTERALLLPKGKCQYESEERRPWRILSWEKKPGKE